MTSYYKCDICGAMIKGKDWDKEQWDRKDNKDMCLKCQDAQNKDKSEKCLYCDDVAECDRTQCKDKNDKTNMTYSQARMNAGVSDMDKRKLEGFNV